MKRYEMRGKKKIGNLLSGCRAELKKVWVWGVYCFLTVSGIFVFVNLDEPRAMDLHYIVDSDTGWDDYRQKQGIGMGRVIHAGDTLEIRNGATLTFDFKNKESPYVIANPGAIIAMTVEGDDDDRVNDDVSIKGGTLVGISHAPNPDPNPDRAFGGGIGLYSTAAITVTGTNLLFQDFDYGFYAEVDEKDPQKSVITVTNSMTKFENVACGMYADNAAVSLTTDAFTMTGGETAAKAEGNATVTVSAGTASLDLSKNGIDASGSSSVFMTGSTLNLKASDIVHAADSAQAALTAKEAGTLQGGVGAYDTSHVTVSLGGTAVWTGFSDKDDGASVSVTLGSGNIWNVRPVYTDGTNYGPSAVSSLSLNGGTVSLDSAAEFQRLNIGSARPVITRWHQTSLSWNLSMRSAILP